MRGTAGPAAERPADTGTIGFLIAAPDAAGYNRRGRGTGGMARFLFPLLLIALGILGLSESAAINSQWDAMYPSDPAEQDALTRCAQQDGVFNRFSPSARAACYQKYLQLPAAAPLTVGIPGAPAHAVPHPGPVRNNSNQR